MTPTYILWSKVLKNPNFLEFFQNVSQKAFLNKDVSRILFLYLVSKMFHVKHYLVVKNTTFKNVSRETFFYPIVLQQFY